MKIRKKNLANITKTNLKKKYLKNKENRAIGVFMLFKKNVNKK